MGITKNLTGFALKIVLLTIFLVGLSYVVVTYTRHSVSVNELVVMYAYLVSLTLLSFALVLIAGSKKYDRAGFTFLGLALIKLMVSFAFLWPQISSKDEAVKPYLFHFFALYFIYLAFEAWQVVKVIQTADPNKGVTQYKDLDKDT